MRMPPLLPAARRGLGRYLRELRASRGFLAEEVRHSRWLDLGRFHWRDIAPGPAARAAFGAIVPLIIGFATGHIEYGTFATLGALPTGFVSFRGVTRSRVLLVVITAAGMAVSSFVGSATEASAGWLLVPLIMLWAFTAGVCASLGPSAVAVSLQWPVALLIASALPLSPAQAGVRAGLVLAGGLWQGVLVVSSWALSRDSAERTAMAGSFAELSRYAFQLAGGDGGPPPPGTLPGASALRDPNPLLRSAARRHLLDLMEEAERIRTTLTALAGPGLPGPARRAFLEASARCLGEIAQALSSRPPRRDGHLQLARQFIDADQLAPGHPRRWAGETLHGQLRTACQITERLNDAEPGRPGRAAPRTTVRVPARDLSVTLRANLGPSSQAGRHALRLAAVTGAAELIAQAADLPHGYWAALTVLIVLRPDYGSTLYRGLQRAAGSVLGAGLGLATVLLGHFGHVALLAGVGVCLFAAYAIFTVNYLAFAVFLTDFVVVLLDLAGLPPEQTALDRLLGTGVGTGLALLAYLLWPTWEHTSANEKFARLFLAQSRLADVLLRCYARPAGTDAARSRSLKLAARRARADAEASADRLADEPDRRPMSREFAQALVSAGHRLALAVLTLEAAVGEHHASLRRAGELARAGRGPDRPDPARPGPRPPGPAQDPDPVQEPLDRLAAVTRQAAAQLAESLRRMGPPSPLPPLRQIQAGIPRDGDTGYGGLFTATDSLVDALNTTADILRRHLAPP